MKIKIYATGNERVTGDYNVSYYIVEKSESFFDWLGELLEKVLDIKGGGQRQAKFWIREKFDEKGSVIGEEVIQKDIDKLIDYHEIFTNKGQDNKGDRLDIFYGERRIFLTFRKLRETREKFAKFLIDNADWIEVKESREELIEKRIKNFSK